MRNPQNATDYLAYAIQAPLGNLPQTPFSVCGGVIPLPSTSTPATSTGGKNNNSEKIFYLLT